jgi:hypothetical protein
LADLARAVGQGEQAEALYRRGLAIVERLVAAEPGNTGYQRDLTLSYERLAEVDRSATGRRGLLEQAVIVRRRLHQAEPSRVDLAEELCQRCQHRGVFSGRT